MTYRPILRFKRGEQTALDNLSHEVKSVTKPLLNFVLTDFDPSPGENFDPAFDARIQKCAVNLNAIWSGYAVAVDLSELDADARCEGGAHPVFQFFSFLMSSSDHALAWPVIRFDSDAAYIAAVANVCSQFNVSPVFRITPDDLADADLATWLSDRLSECGAAHSQADFIVDMGYIHSSGGSIITARGALAAVPFASSWGDLSLVAGSFPENLSGFAIGHHVITRQEWGVWRANRIAHDRAISYGDYATIHPIVADEAIDPRTMNPTASVRYTFEDSWILIRGHGTRTKGGGGFEQFYDHADTIVSLPEYRGETFSFGDEKIMRIHRRQERTGNLENWVSIGVNHHIVEIVGQLAIQP